ncbi:MAG: Sirohydrochlorin cobaltochelatase [Paracidovorax wautersii]|uniref:Sirohydrochlorin cobaltochelatase n=1 Tax=Paracidovorax wautersii TaxID=1177982 RepID=A0A7V8FQ34_9BURK|nr:MAG: Sirohydrochlorin cobaltochelatase [Paracidovorax wautersii]
MPDSAPALILFGHGSRDARWAEPMEAVAARTRALRPGVPVACAYLELMQPDLATACAHAVAQGARDVAILPMFLGRGRHAREDLPELVAQQQRAHPQVRFELRTALGEDPAMVEAIAQWAVGGT